MSDLDDFLMTRPPTAARPLLGLTVLAVEDSRFASEALRLLCLRSGARMRRADSLDHARRHLRVYRPTVVIVDLGLPDGSGAGLIGDLVRATPRIDVILGMSGDPDGHASALKAGANGFLEKPIASITAFQSAILAHLPGNRHPSGPRPVAEDGVTPDRLALREDLVAAAQVIRADPDRGTRRYLAQFLTSLAQSASDRTLSQAAAALEASDRSGLNPAGPLSQLSALVDSRLRHSPPI